MTADRKDDGSINTQSGICAKLEISAKLLRPFPSTYYLNASINGSLHHELIKLFRVDAYICSVHRHISHEDLPMRASTFSNRSQYAMNQDLLAQLQNPPNMSRREYPKIQRVAHHLRNRKDFAEYYSPRMMSLGPIHHGATHLELGEKYKLMWASMYIGGDPQRAQLLHRKIAENIEELKNLYNKDAIDHLSNEELVQVLFLDGCALLEILKHPDILNPEPLNAKVDQLALVRQDALLLENQLPFRVLQLLSDEVPGTKQSELLKQMGNFLRCHHFSQVKPGQNQAEGDSCQQSVVIDTVPAHLLDLLRTTVVTGFRHDQKKLIAKSGTITYRNLKELRAAGIQVKRSESDCPTHITFSSGWISGELRLPEIVVDDTTASIYLNLMAYEVCPDFENNYEISSYVEFLDSLIDHPDDVKELRKANVLHNALGSDEKVADLFNNISTDVVPNAAIYASLREEIEQHYRQRQKTWFALAKAKYFSNPWSIIALIAASVALLLASFQTYFAVFPRHSS
ncbi:UPF0481 protein At3g47200-like [Neltuma alba]|uniref:UPF0481 protein At3g47200-like n=1 Tax=Neltuma alba TaxID=207710 RepID=UPI0010A2F985|nr:UPF0481 protein At3g47200-like [Prosopis alba]